MDDYINMVSLPSYNYSTYKPTYLYDEAYNTDYIAFVDKLKFRSYLLPYKKSSAVDASSLIARYTACCRAL